MLFNHLNSVFNLRMLGRWQGREKRGDASTSRDAYEKKWYAYNLEGYDWNVKIVGI